MIFITAIKYNEHNTFIGVDECAALEDFPVGGAHNAPSTHSNKAAEVPEVVKRILF